jgi:dTDP-glucose pyrophosphorylase
MAGLGSRFSDAGYLLPKALIPVSGKPMIARAIEGMPPSDKWIFIVRQEHIDQYQIDVLISSLIPKAIVIPVSETTEGQASTCMLAMPHLDPAEELFIAACDNSFVYDQGHYARLKADPEIDAIVWTFTKNELLAATPKAWGWIRLAADGRTIADMSVKVPVSNDPFNDHAVVATFWFRRAGDFAAAYDLMVKENYRINNEFYVDSLPVFFGKLGKTSVIFDVDLYVGWGKPADLYQYEKLEYENRIGHLDNPLWQKYFSELS